MEQKAEKDRLEEEMRSADAKRHLLVVQRGKEEARYNQLRQEVQSLEGEKHFFEQSKTSNLSKFGQHIVTLKAAIDKERGWQNKPVGPLGQYMSLKDEAWGLTVETVLGRSYPNFIVTTEHDRKLLQRIIYQQRYFLLLLRGNEC